MTRRGLLAAAGLTAVTAPLAALAARADTASTTGATGGAPAPTAPVVVPATTAWRVPALDPSDCVMRQEFDGPAGSGVDKAVWAVQTGAGGWGNGEQQAYRDSADNLSLDGAGNLRITVRAEPTVDAAGNAARFTSARIETRSTYRASRIEARLSCPSGQGVWPAFWTVGADLTSAGWPRCGELDIAEALNDARTVSSVVHAAALDGAGTVVDQWRDSTRTTFPATAAADAFHVYAVDLAPGTLTFSVDGEVCLVTRREDRLAGQDWPFEQSQRLVLNLAMSRHLPVTESPPLPVSLLVDYVRVWPADV